MLAQKSCGQVDPSKAERNKSFLAKRLEYTHKRSIEYLPIKAYVFREDNGAGGITNKALSKGLAFLNHHFQQSNIQFYYCGAPTYINNSDLYHYDQSDPDNDSEALVLNVAGQSPQAINVYFFADIILESGNAKVPICGKSSFPFTDHPSENIIFMDKDCTAEEDNGTYVHEFGHYFSLFHTHQFTSRGNEHPYAENVARSGPDKNCEENGDQLCDTPADPEGSDLFDLNNCSYTGMLTDSTGLLYEPQVDNIMSYYPDLCGGSFTPDQYTKIISGLALRKGHTSYSLDCSPPGQLPPAFGYATFNEATGIITINWLDQASSEMGYLVEVSTHSSASGFTTILDATGPNEFSLQFSPTITNVIYYFRIKASNGDPLNYSDIISLFVPTTYCAVSTFSCSNNHISEVSMNGEAVSSTCTSGGFGLYQSSWVVSNKFTSKISIHTSNSQLTDTLGVWIDWNNDGDFEDLDEDIEVCATDSISPYYAFLKAPISSPMGPKRMRIRLSENSSPSPCGTTTKGEVEDFYITINEDCMVNPVVFSSKAFGYQSLLEAVIAACPDDTISFMTTINDSIIIMEDEVVIDKNLCLIGNGKNNTFISGNNLHRIFSVFPGSNVELNNMTLRDGYNLVNGGAIYNEGHLILKNVQFENNLEGTKFKVFTNKGMLSISPPGIVNIKK